MWDKDKNLMVTTEDKNKLCNSNFMSIISMYLILHKYDESSMNYFTVIDHIWSSPHIICLISDQRIKSFKYLLKNYK